MNVCSVRPLPCLSVRASSGSPRSPAGAAENTAGLFFRTVYLCECARQPSYLDALMKVASEYRLHAAECRKLARAMPEGDAKQQLITMAEMWERLAQDREAKRPVEFEKAPKEPPRE